MASAPNSSGVAKAQQESEDPQSTADMTAFVQNLLVQMQNRFQTMSDNEMGSRIDELEQSINDLKAEMGADISTGKAKADETEPGATE